MKQQTASIPSLKHPITLMYSQEYNNSLYKKSPQVIL